MCDDKDEATVFHFFIIRDLEVDVELKPETRKEIRNIQWVPLDVLAERAVKRKMDYARPVVEYTMYQCECM